MDEKVHNRVGSAVHLVKVVKVKMVIFDFGCGFLLTIYK